MDDSFVNQGSLAVHKGYFLKKTGSILTLLWQFGASESATASMFSYYFKYLLLTVKMRSFALRPVRVCVGHITRICFPFGLELMLKPRTLLTVFIKLKLAFMVRGVTFLIWACVPRCPQGCGSGWHPRPCAPSMLIPTSQGFYRHFQPFLLSLCGSLMLKKIHHFAHIKEK